MARPISRGTARAWSAIRLTPRTLSFAWAAKKVRSFRDRSIFSTWIDQGTLATLTFVYVKPGSDIASRDSEARACANNLGPTIPAAKIKAALAMQIDAIAAGVNVARFREGDRRGGRTGGVPLAGVELATGVIADVPCWSLFSALATVEFIAGLPRACNPIIIPCHHVVALHHSSL